MSLAWKVTVTVVLFAIAAVAAVILIVNLLGTPPTVDFTRRQRRTTGQRHAADRRLARLGHHPTLGVLPGQVAARAVGAHHRVPGARSTPASTSRSTTTTRAARCVTSSSARSRAPTATSPRSTASRSGSSTRNAGNGVGHTFSIPSLGINVPLYGNNGNANLCAAAPCTPKSPYNVVRFSFTSPGPGNYRWQCFVPCGLGWLFGNGGPMSTLGYMGGFMKVAA